MRSLDSPRSQRPTWLRASRTGHRLASRKPEEPLPPKGGAAKQGKAMCAVVGVDTGVEVEESGGSLLDGIFVANSPQCRVLLVSLPALLSHVQVCPLRFDDTCYVRLIFRQNQRSSPALAGSSSGHALCSLLSYHYGDSVYVPPNSWPWPWPWPCQDGLSKT